MKHILFYLFLLSLALICALTSRSQMITGVWKGKINRQKTEVKIIQNGDSLTGTSYYYESPGHYRRYGIKGYFDANTNEAVWWDDFLIEEKSGRSSGPGKIPLLARADFNCPGAGKMMLDGKAGRPEDENPKGDLHLDKTGSASFPDEWDFVINNYLKGANDPWVIDSVSLIAYEPSAPSKVTVPVFIPAPDKKEPVTIAPPVAKIEVPSTSEPSIQEKFTTREKTFVAEIPLVGDSIELRFYDNAEIDGDSISLFLNDKLILQHIRLLGSAYTIKLAVNDLQDNNELIMVAENLGTIPPNTSYMVAIVNEKRYEARLKSTEGSSAMIRLTKPRN